ncbi:MAG TPA: permease prefix domain 1-containing protein, partial [Vicinamibacterales bacterium]
MLDEVWNDIRYRVRAFLRRNEAERSLNAEIEEHLAREVEALERAGWSPADARRQARVAFGGVDVVKECTRDAWGTALIDSTVHDARYGMRQLRRNPAFACSSIFILALGIASTTVIFSIAYGVLLRALPYDQPDR